MMIRVRHSRATIRPTTAVADLNDLFQKQSSLLCADRWHGSTDDVQQSSPAFVDLGVEHRCCLDSGCRAFGATAVGSAIFSGSCSLRRSQRRRLHMVGKLAADRLAVAACEVSAYAS